MESGAVLPPAANRPSGPPDAVVFTWQSFFSAMFVGWLLARIPNQFAHEFEFHGNSSFPLIVMAMGIVHLVVRRQIRERSGECGADAVVRQWAPVFVCSYYSWGLLVNQVPIGSLDPYNRFAWIEQVFKVVVAPLILTSCVSLIALPIALFVLFVVSLRRLTEYGYATLVETSAITFAIATFFTLLFYSIPP